VEDGAGRGADDLGIVEIDAAAGEDYSVGTRGIRGPDDCAGIARVTHLFEDGNQLWFGGENVFQRGGKLATHRDDSLGSHGVRHRVKHMFADEFDLDTRLFRVVRDVRVTVEGRRRCEELDDEFGSEGEGFGDCLRALEKKLAARDAPFAFCEFGNATDARRTGVI
jgi:hypothetical protein